MDHWLVLAKGPLFALTFLIMALGLTRHVVLQVRLLIVRKRRGLGRLPWRRIALDSLTWSFPLRHFIRGSVLVSAASFLFHLCLIPLSLFLEAHVRLWESLLGVSLPALSASLADLLTLICLVCLGLLFTCRIFFESARALSRPSDYILLGMVVLPLLSGFLAHHPAASPLPWNLMLLIHILSAEALFVAVPFTKLAHIVLYPFDRISEVHWQLRPGAGDRVARALYGEEARV